MDDHVAKVTTEKSNGSNLGKMTPAHFLDKQVLSVIAAIFLTGIAIYFLISGFKSSLGTVSFGGL